MNRRGVGAALLLTALGSPAALAQSVLQRTPNISGGWEATPGTVYFNFLHRFIASGAPERRVTNFPTFLLGAGLPGNILVAANYATRSDLVARYPNEWEFFARAVPLAEFRGFPLDVAVQAGYNLAAESVDGELNVARQLGPVRLLGAARVFSNGFGSDSARFAVAGGALLQLTRWLALAADGAQLIDRAANENSAWSAALQLAIPYTPHTLSLQVANTNTATLQGSSRGSKTRRYGFEFTVPITLARYFGRRETAAADQQAPVRPREDTAAQRVDTARVIAAVPPARDTVRVTRDTAAAPRPAARTAAPPQAPPKTVAARMRQLTFEPRRLQVEAGTSVVWRNNDQVVHTVKAANGSWESPLIQPGGSYRRTFERSGTYEITCGPHPFMKQVVEVR